MRSGVRRATAVAYLGLIVLASPHAQAGPALDRAVPQACRSGHVCVVRENFGGDVALFRLAASEVITEHKTLIIDGPCESACVALADMARRYTCLTPRARMAVHKATLTRVFAEANAGGRVTRLGKRSKRVDPPMSDDIDAWVALHGGYPTDGILVIPVAEARRFLADVLLSASCRNHLLRAHGGRESAGSRERAARDPFGFREPRHRPSHGMRFRRNSYWRVPERWQWRSGRAPGVDGFRLLRHASADNAQLEDQHGMISRNRLANLLAGSRPTPNSGNRLTELAHSGSRRNDRAGIWVERVRVVRRAPLGPLSCAWR